MFRCLEKHLNKVGKTCSTHSSSGENWRLFPLSCSAPSFRLDIHSITQQTETPLVRPWEWILSCLGKSWGYIFDTCMPLYMQLTNGGCYWAVLTFLWSKDNRGMSKQSPQDTKTIIPWRWPLKPEAKLTFPSAFYLIQSLKSVWKHFQPEKKYLCDLFFKKNVSMKGREKSKRKT